MIFASNFSYPTPVSAQTCLKISVTTHDLRSAVMISVSIVYLLVLILKNGRRLRISKVPIKAAEARRIPVLLRRACAFHSIFLAIAFSNAGKVTIPNIAIQFP